MSEKLLFILGRVNIVPNIVLIILGVVTLVYIDVSNFVGYFLIGLGIFLQLIETIFVDLLAYKIKTQKQTKN